MGETNQSLSAILGHLNTTQWMTESSISKYARLLTWAQLLGLLFEWAELQEKMELAPGPQNLATTLFHFFSLYPLLPLHTLPSSSLSPEWAGKSRGRLAAHTPGRQIRTRPPAGPFHPLPECRRDRGIGSYFYSSPPYPFFSLQHEGGWLGFGNGRQPGGWGWVGGQNQEPRGMKRWGSEWVRFE